MKKNRSMQITAIFYLIGLICLMFCALFLSKVHLGWFLFFTIVTLSFVFGLADLQHPRAFPVISGIFEGFCAGFMIMYLLAL